VVAADAGVRLRFGRAKADQIGAAIDKVLNTSFYRYNARRVRDSFHSAGGAAAAARHLMELAATPTPVAPGSRRS
jgi:UDP:flavonoid glycosyltransferase YjiC (YdhE family)